MAETDNETPPTPEPPTDAERRAKHAETLLETISAFAEEAPAFEEVGVELFECGKIIRSQPDTHSMTVKIDADQYIVVVIAQPAD